MSIEKVKAAVKAFEETQSKWSKYGAEDTEPDGVFQSVIWKTFKGKPVDIPVTGDEWDLYTVNMKCGSAARALGAATQKVVEAIKETTIGESGALETYLRDYCWRVV